MIEEIEQIKMPDGTIYSIAGSGSGSEVIANPEEEATDSLKKIQINDTIYNIEGGLVEKIDADKVNIDKSHLSILANNVQESIEMFVNGISKPEIQYTITSSSNPIQITIDCKNNITEINDNIIKANTAATSWIDFHNIRFIYDLDGNLYKKERYYWYIESLQDGLIYNNIVYNTGDLIAGWYYQDLSLVPFIVNENDNYQSGSHYISYQKKNNTKYERISVQEALDDLYTKISSLTRASESEDRF